MSYISPQELRHIVSTLDAVEEVLASLEEDGTYEIDEYLKSMVEESYIILEALQQRERLFPEEEYLI